MAYGLSNGHVTTDVTWPPKVLWCSTVDYPSNSLASCYVLLFFMCVHDTVSLIITWWGEIERSLWLGDYLPYLCALTLSVGSSDLWNIELVMTYNVLSGTFNLADSTQMGSGYIDENVKTGSWRNACTVIQCTNTVCCIVTCHILTRV